MTLEVTDWTYGETPIPATADSLYGTPIIRYLVNGEWTTEVPTAAGTYRVMAEVTETTEYSAAYAYDMLTIAKAQYTVNIRFEDITVVYDGEVHSIVAENLPEGVTVNYDNNGQVDIGEYVVTASFVCNPNYEQIPAMTATLRIVAEEDESIVKDIWFWILLAIAVAETIILIILFLRGNKYKRKYNELREETEGKADSMSAMILLGIGAAAKLTINIILLVLDVVLLALIVWLTISCHKYKKKYFELKKQLEEKEDEAKSDESNDEEPVDDDKKQESEDNGGSDAE